MKKCTQPDDWGLAIELHGLIAAASEALLWLGDKEGDPPSRNCKIKHALAAVRDRTREIEVYRKQREKNG